MLKFFNTLSGQLEEFRPMTEGEVRMYICGPTVWDYAHIGNFRTMAAFGDVLRRRCARGTAGEREDESASNHGWRMCVRLNAVVKPTCHNGLQRRRPKTRYFVSLARSESRGKL